LLFWPDARSAESAADAERAYTVAAKRNDEIMRDRYGSL